MPEQNHNPAPSWTALRRYPRFEASSAVRLHRTDGSGRHHEGICKVVAVGGIGIEIPVEFAVGEELEAEFLATPSAPCRARVVYRRGDEYGLQFLDIV
jgi:hypothetical protein